MLESLFEISSFLFASVGSGLLSGQSHSQSLYPEKQVMTGAMCMVKFSF